jgi:hypothetical protein
VREETKKKIVKLMQKAAKAKKPNSVNGEPRPDDEDDKKSSEQETNVSQKIIIKNESMTQLKVQTYVIWMMILSVSGAAVVQGMVELWMMVPLGVGAFYTIRFFDIEPVRGKRKAKARVGK